MSPPHPVKNKINELVNINNNFMITYPNTYYMHTLHISEWYTTIQKCGISKTFFSWINPFIRQRCIQFIKSDFYILKKYFEHNEKMIIWGSWKYSFAVNNLNTKLY